jgi:signal transduction histidine kinase
MLRGTGSLLVAVFSLLVGTLSLLLWLTHPIIQADGSQRRDSLYLYAAVAELFWSFGVGYMFFEVPLVPWPWWGALPILAGIIWISTTVLFCMEVVGWTSLPDFRWFRRWLFVLIATSPLFTLTALAFGLPVVLTIGYALSGVTNFGFAAFLLFKTLKRNAVLHKLIAVAVILNVVVGFRDLYVYRIDPSYTSITWLRYSSMLFGLTLVYVVLSRFRRASAQAHEMTQTLAARVAAKELELKDSFARLEVLAREQERSAERGRILRDMHDGVGAHISTAIRQLQSGQAKDNEVLLTLRESLDQLKLSIDAMTLPAGDVTALLANLRYRLEPRFKASDIELQWDVELLDPLPRLDDKGMRHLQFLVYGAIANVLQHAGASMLRIEAHRTEQGVRVRIVDNGCGFDTTVPKRKGLLSMDERAKAIGATLAVRSSPGGTVVEFLIS